MQDLLTDIDPAHHPPLLACPFCGTEPVQGVSGPQIYERADRRRRPTSTFYVVCDECGACGPSSGMQGEALDSPDEAATAWNARGEVHRVALDAAKQVAKQIVDAALGVRGS
jgi:hypothetical protein